MPKTPADTKLAHIRLIICRNPRAKAAELIKGNGYVKTIEEAEKIIDREDGK